MNTPPSTAPHPLTLRKEQTYFVVVLVFSLLVWLALAATIFGLVWAAVIAGFIWLVNGLAVAALRSGAVRISERQIPELHATFRAVCAQLGVTEPPALYVLQAGGALHAFAARHTGRNFVVVSSDLLEAFGPSSPEIRFVLGHEIGHIRSNHLLKRILLAPGLLLPLAGPAYSRACESSCDRYGAAAAADLPGALRAMLTLGGGRNAGRNLDPAAFADQYREERGFFVSWHELTSGYPTLSKRANDLRALHDPALAAPAPRNPLALIAALFTPGGRIGGTVDVLIVIIIIGLLAAMAIPAFQKVRQNAQLAACRNAQRLILTSAEQFILQRGKAPDTVDALASPNGVLNRLPVCPAGGTYTMGMSEDKKITVSCSIHGETALLPARSSRAGP